MTFALLALLLLAQSPPDDSAALNALFRPGATIQLEPRDYGISAPLDGTVPGVTLRGSPGLTRLVKLPADTHGILNLDAGRTYRGWTFEGVEFSGGYRPLAGQGQYFSLFLDGTRDVRFHRCSFRDLFGPVHLRDSSDVAFDDCDFFGTRAGAFQSGVRDPDPVPGAKFTSGISIDEQVRGVAVSRCRFHFCETGVAINAQPFQSAEDVRVEGCTFRADWWDNPAPVLRFQASKVVTAVGVAPRITVPSGGLSGFVKGQVISFRRDRASGPALKRVYGGNVNIEGDAFGRAAVGDVLELADGRRGRIGSVESPSSVWIDGWESADTYEPTGQPAPATPWRLSRYYACGIAGVVSDTEADLYFEPVNPPTGERALTDAKLDLTTLPARVLARTIYSGFHASTGRGVLVQGNTFRGSWADQCSMFEMPEGARVIGNRFVYGQDEAITLTHCPGSVVNGNTFIKGGVSAVFFGGSDGCTFTGNVIRDWGLVNYNSGAVDCYGSRGLVVEGNNFTVATAKALNWCRYDASYREGDCSGAIHAGNVGGGTVAALMVDAKAAPRRDAITAPRVRVVGAGKGNVRVAP
jgi:hypothetical protein